MDTKEKEKFLNNHVVISLPDDDADSSGAATLFAIPRDAIQAWIKMTPMLSEAMNDLKLAATKAWVAENPAEALKALKGRVEDMDMSSVQSLMERPEFSKIYSTIVVAAILDMRKTWGIEDFHKDYAITDPEKARELVDDQPWKSYKNGRGWADREAGNETLTVQDDGSVHMHLTED